MYRGPSIIYAIAILSVVVLVGLNLVANFGLQTNTSQTIFAQGPMPFPHLPAAKGALIEFRYDPTFTFHESKDGELSKFHLFYQGRGARAGDIATYISLEVTELGTTGGWLNEVNLKEQVQEILPIIQASYESQNDDFEVQQRFELKNANFDGVRQRIKVITNDFGPMLQDIYFFKAGDRNFRVISGFLEHEEEAARKVIKPTIETLRAHS